MLAGKMGWSFYPASGDEEAFRVRVENEYTDDSILGNAGTMNCQSVVTSADICIGRPAVRTVLRLLL